MKHEINVPKGCKVVSVETNDEMVVVKFEKEEPEFKENDIIVIDEYTIAILENRICDSVFYNVKTHINIIDSKLFISESTLSGKCRLATDSEKQLLFDKLKDKCLMFDGENIVRWRAEIGGHYYCLSSSRVDTRAEEHFFSDNENYRIGNYFPTKELAEQFKQQYIDLLNNFHKNL